MTDFAEFVTGFDGTDFGVTGSRRGGTQEQGEAFDFAIENLHEHGGHRLHHGGAQGMDARAHGKAYRLRCSGMKVTMHPPVKKQWAAVDLPMWEGCEILPDRAYGARDYDIVLASSVLIACPQYPVTDYRSAHSGTWLTVSFAWKEELPVFVITPYGDIVDYTDHALAR